MVDYELMKIESKLGNKNSKIKYYLIFEFIMLLIEPDN